MLLLQSLHISSLALLSQTWSQYFITCRIREWKSSDITSKFSPFQPENHINKNPKPTTNVDTTVICIATRPKFSLSTHNLSKTTMVKESVHTCSKYHLTGNVLRNTIHQTHWFYKAITRLYFDTKHSKFSWPRKYSKFAAKLVNMGY